MQAKSPGWAESCDQLEINEVIMCQGPEWMKDEQGSLLNGLFVICSSILIVPSFG
jgi:hypothetical protein